MARGRRIHRLHGRYRLSRVRQEDIDEEDGNETVIEYSTGSDSDEEANVPRRRVHNMPRGWMLCSRMSDASIWQSIRDLAIVCLLITWLIYNFSDHQKEKFATWQKWWDSTAVPTVRNITTESVASLRRFHNHRAPKTDP